MAALSRTSSRFPVVSGDVLMVVPSPAAVSGLGDLIRFSNGQSSP